MKERNNYVMGEKLLESLRAHLKFREFYNTGTFNHLSSNMLCHPKLRHYEHEKNGNYDQIKIDRK